MNFFPPNNCTRDGLVGLAWSTDRESNGGGCMATGMVSHAEPVMGMAQMRKNIPILQGAS